MKTVTTKWGRSSPQPSVVIWHTEGTAISGLFSWMWRLKKSLPMAGIELTLVSLEIQPFRFLQICEPEKIYDVRIRTAAEFIAFLKSTRASVHLINHAFEYVDLLEKIHPGLLQQLKLVGICHTDQDYYYHHLHRLDEKLSGIVAVSPRCLERLEQVLPHRQGTIPVLPAWDVPIESHLPKHAEDKNRPLQVLFNGRLLHLQKRVLDLPVISGQLAHSQSRVQLTVVGDGPDLPRLREEFERGHHIPVRLLSPRAPWEMNELLAENDVFLQTSEFEGASVSLMEAMAAGLVPVVTNTQSGIELLEHERNALLCPVGEISEIAKTLATLAADREIVARLRKEAFLTAKAYLGELNYAHNLQKYIEDVQQASLVEKI